MNPPSCSTEEVSPVDFEKAKTIFAEAVALTSPAGRAAYLAAACAGDRALREQIEAWLAAQNQLGNFLEPAFAQTPADGAEVEGTRIGPYRILEKIGEGGFGFVYMAEQESPVRRKVALKVIKAGMDTKQVIARFEAERQALAMMDHPSIARVLEAGETDSGRPYFVMELVKGVPITEFCDRKKLTARARLELFIRVCHAVQHAHQKGIIHRDLKPSNVMITMVDGQPVPKVIDFGVAKAVEQRLTDKTLFTRYDQLIGTPAYMSPEQAELSGQDVDTRSDIYSLGVLLYELLTGTSTIDSETLRKAGLDDLRRLIRETDPPPPSTRLRSLGEKLTTVAESRQAEPATLCKTIRGDLDWIVMKCLEKDRTRRYETANALTMDLHRHLNHEPVVARPPGNFYRFSRFVRRNRIQVAFAASVAAAVVIGLILAVVGFAQARRERDRALAAHRQAKAHHEVAQAEAARSAQVAQFLKQMLSGVAPAAARGRDTSMLREILDQTALRLEKELAGQPQVEADLRATLGQVYRDLGDYTNAATMHLAALTLRKKLHGDEHLDVATSLYDLGDVRARERKPAEAETLFREALTIRQKLLGNKHPDVAMSLNRLASVLRRQGGPKSVEAEMKYAEAETSLRELLATRRAVLGNEHPDVLWVLDRLAFGPIEPGKYPEAEAEAREAVALRRKLFGDEDVRLASSLENLANLLFAQGKATEAEAAIQEAMAIQRKALGDEHPELAQSLHSLASVLKAQGRLGEAESLQREALTIYDKVAPHSWDAFSSRTRLGSILLAEKKYEEAEPLLLAGYEGIMPLRDQAPSSYTQSVTQVMKLLVQLYEEYGKPAQAAAWKQKLAEFDRRESRTQADVPKP